MTTPLHQVWQALDGAPEDLDRLTVTGPPAPLRSRFAVTDAGIAAVGASLLAATDRPVGLDTRALAIALRSERYVLRGGRSAGSVFDPLSAFHRTADGWLRLHANYPWHRAAALRVLGCTVEQAPAAIAERTGVELETALHEAGGVAAAVRTPEQWREQTGTTPPLVEQHVVGDAAPRPVRRPRVVDLTRVIAGPVATRTLALHGADVLRLDRPDRPELPLQAADTLPGKRSALLDLHDAARREELLAGADVVVTGYRPGALDAFGLSPQALAERHPGLVVVTLSAWGEQGPWGARRGFDSLVQAACGIAVEEGSADAPGTLPAQALDHATGYLGAAAALLALATQRRNGGTRHVRLSLVGTATWLQSLPRTAAADTPDVDPTPYLQEIGDLTLAAPPGTVDGRPLRWSGPAPSFGTAEPRWR
ncbi:CoA transferase [Pseudonocardia abyssalis]|uniref:CoA transferase n=1 Tax=Pseudonocardia abyssalis TaxID=2792008 RepID=A0ABS6UT36_9PSEU|nr:CoA transferase [Pseudonocardia abyssalis]MBW0114371.1 CoA transferase [Pseudonocardia abyssalis]MBW0135387.1 CoA transferase [Pseudonocardia abyssalis]